jgi:hypothetical protein
MFGGVQGAIHRDPAFNDAMAIDLRPLLLSFRPLEPSLHEGVDLSHCELVSSREIVDEVPCMRLRIPPLSDKLHQYLLVDPARDYVVVRYVSELDQKLSIQFDIDYAEDVNFGWVPSAWKSVWYDATGAVSSKYSAKVDYAINGKHSEKLFVIDFPPGALVIDEVSDARYRVGSEGEMDLIPPQKPPVAKKPAVLLPSADAVRKSKAWNDRMMRGTLFVVVGALVVLCVAALWRGRRRTG